MWHASRAFHPDGRRAGETVPAAIGQRDCGLRAGACLHHKRQAGRLHAGIELRKICGSHLASIRSASWARSHYSRPLRPLRPAANYKCDGKPWQIVVYNYFLKSGGVFRIDGAGAIVPLWRETAVWPGMSKERQRACFVSQAL